MSNKSSHCEKIFHCETIFRKHTQSCCLSLSRAPLLTALGADCAGTQGNCDEADCSTLCPNKENVTHFRQRGVVVVHFPTEAPTARCDAALSQSPWEGKQAASRLFLSKKLCNPNLKKHIKIRRGQISNNCNQMPFHMACNFI